MSKACRRSHSSALTKAPNTLCDLHLSKTCEKRDVSSAKILQVHRMLSVKSLIYIRNKRGPRAEPCGTPDFIKFPRRDPQKQ